MRKRAVKRYAEGDYVETYESLGRRLKEREDADRGSEIVEVPSGSIETKELKEQDSVPETRAKNLASDRGQDTSYSREQTEAKNEARRIRAEIERKRAAKKARDEKKSVRSPAPTPDESAAETSRLARQAKITSDSKTADKKSNMSGYGALAALAGAALAGGALGSRRTMKEGTRQDRSEPTVSSGSKLKYIQEIDPMYTGRPDFTQGPIVRKKGGSVKMASGGKTSSASSRADGIATRGKTRGRIC